LRSNTSKTLPPATDQNIEDEDEDDSGIRLKRKVVENDNEFEHDLGWGGG
jgi:hypothetical protein